MKTDSEKRDKRQLELFAKNRGHTFARNNQVRKVCKKKFENIWANKSRKSTDVFGVIALCKLHYNNDIITMMSEQRFSLKIMMTFELPLHKL